jgi:pimeloyl-ACP methyl ester carboxylesterase
MHRALRHATALLALAATPALAPAQDAAAQEKETVPSHAPKQRRGALPSSPEEPARATNAREVELATQDKLLLRATYYPPKVRGEKVPGVLLVHDAEADRSQLTALAEGLQKKGFGVLALDLRGHGASATPELSWSETAPAERPKLWTASLRDLAAGGRFLREQPEVHASNLSLVAVGASCGLAVRHAAKDENARTVVLVAPRTTELGFDVQGEVRELGGLPTLILTEKGGRERAASIVEAGHKANGTAHIELEELKAAPEELLADAKLPNEVASWLKQKVVPKREQR